MPTCRAFRRRRAEGSAGGTGIAHLQRRRSMPSRTTRSSAIALAVGRASCRSGQPQVDPLRPAAHRRSPDASVRHRRQGPHVRRSRLGDQFLPAAEPHRRIRPAISPAPSSRPAPASGATTPTRQVSVSRRRSAMPPASATARALRSTPPAGCLSPSTAATSCRRTGRAYTRPSRARTAGRGNRAAGKGGDYGWPECYYRRARRTSSCWRRNMAATAARRSASAPRKQRPVASFPGHWAPNDLLIYAGNAFPAALSRRRVRRLPWLVESRAGAAGRLQRRVPAAQGRQGRRALYRLRRWLCRRGERAGPGGVPAVGTGDGARRRALYLRRHARPHLARHLSRRSRRGAGAGRVAKSPV